MSTTEAMPGELTEPEQAAAHLWPHIIEWDQIMAGEMPVLVSGTGCTVTDVHGRESIDGLSGIWVVNAGHGRAEIGAAMAEQASRLAYSSSTSTANPANIALAETVASLTPGDLDRVFLCSGGSEAVETALKIAKQAQFLRGYPKRYKVICRRGGYHGATFGAMSLSHGIVENYFGPLMAGVSKIPSPNRYRNDFGLEGEAGDLMCASYLEQEILVQGPEQVAAFIAEPISVNNGTHLPSRAYWQEVRRICDKYGVLLIMDEVINGFGRTGKMFAAERYGVVPDIMTMAKGITSGYAPLGAVAVRPEVFEPFKKHGSAFDHLLTFGGQAVSAAAASKTIEIYQREDLVTRSANLGKYLFERADALRSHPTVGDVRGGLGLLCTIELVRNKETKESWGRSHEFTRHLILRTREEGLITRIWEVLHLAPPFVITEQEIDRMIDIVDRCLTDAEARFAGEIGT
jgi:adenosylmethionine-8-amino-7-oxononanoate aminotransferase